MPPRILHRDDVPETPGQYPPPFDGELLSHGRDLGSAAGVERLGTWMERLPVGHRTSRLHAHLREEEAIYVLAGTPSVRWREADGREGRTTLRPGSFCVFPAGTGLAHTVENPGPGEAELLVIGERQPAERIAYPEDPTFEAWRIEQGSDRRWTDIGGPNPEAKAPAWRIQTARLTLRPFRITDIPAFIRVVAANQGHLWPWMPWIKEPHDPDSVADRFLRFQAAFARGEDFLYGIFLDGAPVGGTGLHLRVGPQAAEIGYWISAEHEGKGLVSEAVRAVARVGLSVNRFDRVEIRMHPDNVRSRAVPPRLGFTHEATLSRRFPGPEGLHDVLVWSLYADQIDRVMVGEEAHILRAWDVLDRRLI